MLATDDSTYPLTDKELYQALMKYKSELDMNTLSTEDMEKAISNTEELFKDLDPDHIFYEDYEEDEGPVF